MNNIIFIYLSKKITLNKCYLSTLSKQSLTYEWHLSHLSFYVQKINKTESNNILTAKEFYLNIHST